MRSEPAAQTRLLREKIRQIQDLPTLPRIAMQVLELLQDPYFSIEALDQILSHDPVLCAKILRIANSAYYSLRFPVDSVRRAFLVLGAREIQQMVLTLSVFKVFRNGARKVALDREKFWEHSANSAVLARAFILKLREMAQRNLSVEPEVAFSAGLLHDLGKLVMDHYFQDDFRRVATLIESHNFPPLLAEKEVFGEDHAAIGAWLARHWQLPENIVFSIEFHHDPGAAPAHQLLTLSAQAGNLFSRMNDKQPPGAAGDLSSLEKSFWLTLQKWVPEVEALDSAQFARELEGEFTRARQLLDLLQS